MKASYGLYEGAEVLRQEQNMEISEFYKRDARVSLYRLDHLKLSLTVSFIQL